MPRFVKVAGIKGLDLKIDKSALEKATAKINEIFRQAAREMVKVAKARAPYDPKSRHAKGETTFPETHHRDSIRFGQMVSKKGQAGEANRAMNLGFFGVNGGPLKYAFIRSNSGRGYWLEKGTSGAKKGGQFAVKRKGPAARQARRINQAIAAGDTYHIHYATKRQRHFEPGMSAAKRYIKNNLRNVF